MLNAGILDDEEFENLISNKTVTIIDYSAVWCGPCRMIHPIVEHLADKYKSKYHFYEIDIDSAENIALRQNITAVPTIVVYKAGKELGRTSGYQEFEELEKFILSATSSAKTAKNTKKA